ncbi:uncharacterized protein HD556DRAFT_329339 [Suillus plorans]|uniref:DUF6534 domain-containing protein n=1 Tax=Suillus plorans TaxID=116603 RepID=A0A9P7DZ65_9AGAM|nr:uncharacterized protein HD556DRAFT_329339 [Suillus plorans]KAG1806644.1 hypothetical protein HD556DRAFT_329339 [Suillus plorans]
MSVNAVAAAADVLIAAYICTFFQKFCTGFRRPDTVPDKLILLTISNGLLISVCVSFISISIWPDTFIYIAFYVYLGRLYQCYSLLVTLNARKGLRSHFRDDNMLLSLQGINHVTGTSQRASAVILFLDVMRQFAPNENSSALDLLKL